MDRVSLVPADWLEVTILVDNQIDALLPGDETVRRRGWGPATYNPLLDAPEVITSMKAEHGFSALVTLGRGDAKHTLLFDTGVSPDGMVENMDRLEIRPVDVEALVLSHGHFDHTGGIQGLTDRLGKQNLPLLAHPHAYRQRRMAPPEGEPLPLPPPSRAALEGAGFEVIDAADPALLLDGCLLITGEVPRVTSFEEGFPLFQHREGARWEPEPHLLDDQGIVVNVKGRGLVVITGCGHSGIVNIVTRARALTGQAQVAGIIGGFHLSGQFFEPILGRTVESLAAFEPDVVVPGHCTGYRAQMALAAALPEAFVQNAVGTTYRF